MSSPTIAPPNVTPVSPTPAPAPIQYSLEDQIRCVGREIGKRLQVYQRLVDTGRMTLADAQRELDTMRAVYATLKALQPPPPQQNLFTTEHR